VLTEAERRQRMKNIEAIAARRRKRRTCHMGHSLRDAYIRPDGRRECRKCKKAAQQRWDNIHRGLINANPDHPLHGTNRGYRLRCKCLPCRIAGSRYRAGLITGNEKVVLNAKAA